MLDQYHDQYLEGSGYYPELSIEEKAAAAAEAKALAATASKFFDEAFAIMDKFSLCTQDERNEFDTAAAVAERAVDALERIAEGQL